MIDNKFVNLIKICVGFDLSIEPRRSPGGRGSVRVRRQEPLSLSLIAAPTPGSDFPSAEQNHIIGAPLINIGDASFFVGLGSYPDEGLWAAGLGAFDVV